MSNALVASPYSSWCEVHLDKFRLGRGKWGESCCPLHQDRKPSLRVDVEGGGYHCNSSSCPHPDGHLHQLANHAGLPMVGLPNRSNGKSSKLELKAEYSYPSADGRPFGLVRRYWDSSTAEKTFRQLTWKDGQWAWGAHGKGFPIYRADKIASTPTGSIILWVEGEKCADLAVKLGFEATTSARGAQGLGSCDKDSLALLAGRRVVVLPDNDKPGRDYAREVLATMRGVADAAVVQELPGLPEKGDLVDWVQAGGTAEALRSLIESGLQSPTDLAKGTGQGDDEGDEEEELPQEASWPTLHPAALYGLAGRFVKTIEPFSETDPVALLLTFLTCVGHVMTSKPHFVTEADNQTGALFVCLVGKSARGRKGSSLGWIEKLFSLMVSMNPNEEERLRLNELRGLASGEGLIERMKDPEGALDRDWHRERLLVIETELAGILQRMAREGSILSPILRQAWDGKIIENSTKANPARVSHPHMSLLGHVTQFELMSLFKETEVFNGLGNRFLWACVRRSKYLPIGGQPSEDALRALADELSFVLSDVQRLQRLHFSPQAEAHWRAVYPILEADKPTPFVDAMTARSAAQVVRLSLIYALLDRSYSIELPHLMAALAVWDYCEQSVAVMHPAPARNDLEAKIVRALKAAGESGRTRTELNRDLSGHPKTEKVTETLRKLKAFGLVQEVVTPRPGAVQGRFVSRYFFVDKPIASVRDYLEEHWDPHLRFERTAQPIPCEAEPPVPPVAAGWQEVELTNNWDFASVVENLLTLNSS